MAHARHKRDTDARPKSKAALVAAPLAVLATACAVTLGVLASDPPAREVITHQATDQLVGASRSSLPVSRSDARRTVPAPAAKTTSKPDLMSKEAVRAAIKGADEQRWTTDELNLWAEPIEKAKLLGELESGSKVLITGRAAKGRVEIALKGQSRWVTEGYLSTEKPPTIGGDCTNGTSVESGVSANIAAVHEAVCAVFPTITTYGALRGGGGDHGSGRAVDIMVSGSLGYEVAEFVREHYDVLGVSYVIYSQRIWSVERGGEGWRSMSSRGSATANHYDHVHVSTY